ncbi:MAG: hypothetical protein OEZ36_05605, partial [Spirochaetota bacterium]|nr:hypothetical protein [Spirochaetota bacterium]
YTGQGKLSRVDHLDSENRLMSYTNYKYQGDKLISKTAYSRDQKLSGSDEYYKLIFLDYVENYRPDGKIATKLWYHKDDAPNKLYWTDRYSYRGIHTYINSYNPKNKLIHEKVLISATGKVIISKIHEQN